MQARGAVREAEFGNSEVAKQVASAALALSHGEAAKQFASLALARSGDAVRSQTLAMN